MFVRAWPRLGQWQCVRKVGIKHNVNFNKCNFFANKVHIEKFKIQINSLFYFIDLLVLRNERQYLAWFIFIKLLFILI